MRWLALTTLLWLFLHSTPALALHVVSPEAHIDITTDKVAHLVEEVHSRSLRTFKQEYGETADLPGPRIVIINSPGGEVPSGEGMIEILEAEKARGVKQICVVIDHADSMAFNLLSHCSVRLAVKGASMTMHKIAVGGINCATERCTAKRLQELVDELNQDDEPLRVYNAKTLKMSLKDYDLYADQDHVWSPESLLRRGYLHGYAIVQK